MTAIAINATDRNFSRKVAVFRRMDARWHPLATPARVGVFALAGVLLIVGAFLYMKFRERFEDHA